MTLRDLLCRLRDTAFDGGSITFSIEKDWCGVRIVAKVGESEASYSTLFSNACDLPDANADLDWTVAKLFCGAVDAHASKLADERKALDTSGG